MIHGLLVYVYIFACFISRVGFLEVVFSVLCCYFEFGSQDHAVNWL